MKETTEHESNVGMTEKWKIQAKSKVDRINTAFNALPLRTKQVTVIFFGMALAMICIVLVAQAFQAEMGNTISIDKITLPKDTFMKQTDTTKQLIPVGKLKGEINGEFEAFYVAVDEAGQAYINRDPEFGANRFVKSEQWQPISQKELAAYEKELHFIPHKAKGLRP
jgi:hypothetical protein